LAKFFMTLIIYTIAKQIATLFKISIFLGC
jgi:hypothetical protein